MHTHTHSQACMCTYACFHQHICVYPHVCTQIKSFNLTLFFIVLKPFSGLLLVIQLTKQLTHKYKWAPTMCQLAHWIMSVEETRTEPTCSSSLCLDGKSLPLVPVTPVFTTWLSLCCHLVLSWYHHKNLGWKRSMGTSYFSGFFTMKLPFSHELQRCWEPSWAHTAGRRSLPAARSQAASLVCMFFAMFSCLVPYKDTLLFTVTNLVM